MPSTQTAQYVKYGLPAFGQLVSTNINGSTLKTWGWKDAAPWLTLAQAGNAPRGAAIYPDLSRMFRQSSAMYGNVLSGGLAGHIYGADGLWQGRLSGSPLESQAIVFTSGAQMGHLHEFMLSEGKAYQDLVPENALLAPNHTGSTDQEGGAYCAHTAGKSLFLLYFEKGALRAALSGLTPKGNYRASWYDPRAGTWSDAGNGQVTAGAGGAAQLPAFPGGEAMAGDDWALKLSNGVTSGIPQGARRARAKAAGPIPWLRKPKRERHFLAAASGPEAARFSKFA